MTIGRDSKRVPYPLLGSASAAFCGSTERGLEGWRGFFFRRTGSRCCGGVGNRARSSVGCELPKTLPPGTGVRIKYPAGVLLFVTLEVFGIR